MAHVEVNGVKIACYDEGRGDPPFVFIHGWACDHSFWQLQFDDLKRDFRCLSVDLRGRGDSEAVGPYDTTTAADDVAAVMRARGVGPAIIAGHSLGGLVALLLNDRHPDLVLGIVLGDSPLSAARSGAFAQTIPGLRAAGSMEPIRDMVESFFLESTAHDIRDHARKTMLSCPVDVAVGMIDRGDVFVERMDDLLKAADAKPFMAIWAAHPLGDPGHLREITTFLRQEPVPGVGHFFQLEKPAVTNALLRAFVDDVNRDPRLRRPS